MNKRKLFDARLTGTFLQKNRKTYIFLLMLIALFELVMMVRGVILFDFTNPRRILYMISYGILFTASVVAAPILMRDTSMKVLSITLHVYALLILLWSLLISYLDMQGHGYPLVYLTIIVTLGGAVVINPILYAVATTLATISIVIMDKVLGGGAFNSTGEKINFLVFIAMCFVIAFRQYSLLSNELKHRDLLEELSVKDTLTGLANENAYIQDTMKMKENKAEKYAVILLDVNNLGKTNEKLGHRYGTFLITETAKALKEIFTTSGLYHTEGDTFVVLVENKDLENIVSKLSLIEKRLSHTVLTLDERDVVLSVAYGVAFHTPGQEYDQVFHLADTAMRDNKAQGRR